MSIAADGEGLAVVAVNQSGSLAFESRGPPQSLRHLGHPFPFRCSLPPRGANGLALRRSDGGSGVVRRSNAYDVEKVDCVGGP